MTPLDPHQVAPDVPRYVTMKEAMAVIADRFACSRATLYRLGVHELLGSYALGYRRGKLGLRRVPEEAIEEVIQMMHQTRIP